MQKHDGGVLCWCSHVQLRPPRYDLCAAWLCYGSQAVRPGRGAIAAVISMPYDCLGYTILTWHEHEVHGNLQIASPGFLNLLLDTGVLDALSDVAVMRRGMPDMHHSALAFTKCDHSECSSWKCA